MVITLQPVGPAAWQLGWVSETGARYQLQKSGDLQQWTEVITLTAFANNTSFIEEGLPGRTGTFWRLVRLSAGSTDPLVVSPVVAGYRLTPATSKALLQLVTGGTQAVRQVVFLDNGVVLGNAVQGFGNMWSFNLVWDGRTLQQRRLSAIVTGADGTTTNTPVQPLLLADPGRFVPVLPDGTRAYGEFIPIDDNGRLDSFIFLPEGLGNAATKCGAHFEFGAGALMRLPGAGGLNEIEFSNARFYRGERDDAPIAATPGTRRLPVDQVTRANVLTALGQSSGTSLQLLFGNAPLEWTEGALGDLGWAGIKVRPPWGNFQLPTGQECALVTFNPRTHDPTLVLCFHGDWRSRSFSPTSAFRSTEPRRSPYLEASVPTRHSP